MPFDPHNKAIQTALIALGYAMPKYGADGHAGAETFEAAENWIANKGRAAPAPAVKTGLSRIILHWSAGTYTVSTVSKSHYHFIVDKDGNEHVGYRTPEDNISTADNRYAAHTYRANTGSIGIAVEAMAGAEGWPLDPGRYPITTAQIDGLARTTARVAAEYGIPITRQTVLTHAEVEPTLGIAQRGKWDIRWLPGMTAVGDAIAVGDKLRALIIAAKL